MCVLYSLVLQHPGARFAFAQGSQLYDTNGTLVDTGSLIITQNLTVQGSLTVGGSNLVSVRIAAWQWAVSRADGAFAA